MRFIIISIGGAPQPQRRGLTRVSRSCGAYSAKAGTGLAEERAFDFRAFPRGKPDATCRKMLGCADLALLYGKAGGLSPFPGAFRAFLVAVLRPQEIGPPLARQRLRFGPAPGDDPGV